MAELRRMSELAQLSVDAYTGKVDKFNVNDAEALIREKLNECVGGKWNYRNFKKNEHDFYALIEELITINLSNLTVESFGDWVEVKDFELGDKIEFRVENTNLFQVGNIATGTNTIRRQRMLDSKLPTTAYKMSIAIYEEFDRFLAGRIDWAKLVDKVSKSFNREVALQVSRTVQNAYTSIHTNLKYEGTYTDAQLSKLIAKVKGLTGQEVAIYGVSEAVENIQGANCLADLADRRAYGYVKEFKGIPVIELPQTYDAINDKWGVRNDILYVIPANEKIVRVGFEGEAMVLENTDGTKRNDQQIEYKFQRMMHLGVLSTARFGAYVITA
ncbi:MAG: hypothetical protein ACRDDY_05250 [Clostridium sp.]|uniref:hypothetical protein n=1 Tax=Clostridium sp. TaxID=1506 RepID=UPI003EE7D7B9